MSQPVTVSLSDEEYSQLAAEAAKNSATIEALAHRRLLQTLGSSASLDVKAIQKYLSQQGVAENIPSGEADSAEDEAETERLAHLLGSGKSVADMVIEDRGPFSWPLFT